MEEQASSNGNAVVKGRYEVTVPEAVIGPYVDISEWKRSERSKEVDSSRKGPAEEQPYYSEE